MLDERARQQPELAPLDVVVAVLEPITALRPRDTRERAETLRALAHHVAAYLATGPWGDGLIDASSPAQLAHVIKGIDADKALRGALEQALAMIETLRAFEGRCGARAAIYRDTRWVTDVCVFLAAAGMMPTRIADALESLRRRPWGEPPCWPSTALDANAVSRRLRDASKLAPYRPEILGAPEIAPGDS